MKRRLEPDPRLGAIWSFSTQPKKDKFHFRGYVLCDSTTFGALKFRFVTKNNSDIAAPTFTYKKAFGNVYDKADDARPDDDIIDEESSDKESDESEQNNSKIESIILRRVFLKALLLIWTIGTAASRRQ